MDKTPEKLKALDIVELSWLTHLFSVKWRSGTVPVEWQTEVVMSHILLLIICKHCVLMAEDVHYPFVCTETCCNSAIGKLRSYDSKVSVAPIRLQQL